MVAALFAAYLIGFFLIGPQAFGEKNHYWATTLVCVATFVTAVRTARRVEPVLRPFFGLVAVSFASQAIELVTWEQGIYLLERDPQTPGRDALQLYMVFSLVFHFTWVCAWGFLCLQLLREGAATRVVNRAVLPLAILIASIFAIDYLAGLSPDVPSTQANFERINEVLHMTGLIFGLTGVLLGVRPGYAVMNFGYVLLAASNFLFHPVTNQEELLAADAIAALWDLGLYTIWAGILMVPRSGSSDVAERHPAVEPTSRSGLSSLLLLFVLVSSLLGMYSGVLLGNDRYVRLSAYLLIAVVSVVVMHRIGGRFDRAVGFVELWSQGLLRNRLDAEPWTGCEPSTRNALETTGLASVLESLGKAALWLRSEVLFLGPERLYPPAERRTDGRISSFIVMPFSEGWSDAVGAVIKDCCKDAGIHPIRGDDLYTPSDILDDIWQGINRADFIIADITSRNPNVLYELGIAHTLAKPVLILSQSADDIPIDLSTRRVLVYERDALGTPSTTDLEAKLAKALPGIVEEYGFGIK